MPEFVAQGATPAAAAGGHATLFIAGGADASHRTGRMAPLAARQGNRLRLELAPGLRVLQGAVLLSRRR